MSPVTLQAAIRMYGPVSDHGPSFFSRPICRDFASHGTRSMNTAVELLQVSCGAGVGRCRSCQKTRKVCRHGQPQTPGSVVFFTPDLPRNRAWKPTSVASIFRMAAPIAPKFCSYRQASMNVQIRKNGNDRRRLC